MPWLSLTLQLDAAAAERFTQALLDAGAQSVSLENPQGGLQAVGALLGMNVDAGALVREAASAAGLETAPAFRADQLEDEDWVRRSQAQFAPLEIGARLWIGPSWRAPPADGRAVVRLDPGLAFGTGSHPSTRLALRFLERELRGGEGVLDYGCGSGILAIAAAKLGANVDAGALVRDAASAAGLETAPAFRADQLEDEDWVRRSQAQFAPLEIGARLWIGPSWHAPPADGRAVVRLDPGLAFGTGSHPSTRLVLRFLERELRGGESVLDYGCGSGILAIAAAKLGAARVDAVDIDPQALEVTAANARENRAAVRASRPEALAPQLYDVVVSNILAQPLIVLAPLLAARTAPEGRIALAGVLEAQALEVAARYSAWFDASLSSIDEGWGLIEGIRK